MALEYLTYRVRKSDGTFLGINIPNWDALTYIDSLKASFQTIDDIALYWNDFPRGCTWFCPSIYKQTLLDAGLYQVLTEEDGELFFENGNSINIRLTGSSSNRISIELKNNANNTSIVSHQAFRYSSLGAAMVGACTMCSPDLIEQPGSRAYNRYQSFFVQVSGEIPASGPIYLYQGFGVPTSHYYPQGYTGSSENIFEEYLENPEPIPDPQPDDPFAPGGTSEPGGGGGTFDDESDEIPDSSLPTLSAANTGFTRIYNPTLSQVQAMANYLWTDDTVIETIWNHIKQFLEDPMDAFIAFNLVPCVVPNGGTSNFKVMYIDTGVPMTTAANQFVDVDCGTVQLERYYGSALDYTPYTRIGCFLPYIGTVELDTDEVMGATLQVKYRIDIVSGACVAKIFVDGTCLYQYSGHCAINIPFTSADFSNYVNAIIQVAKAGLIAASGVPITAAGAGEAAEQLTGRTVTTTKMTRRNPATGRQIVAWTETAERDIYSTEASFKGLSPTNLANTVGAVMGSKPMIEHSGGFNGNSGYLGIRRPFLIIKRPRMCNPSGYGTLNGYPCMIKDTLGNLSGFTQVQQVQLTGLSATNPEQAEILQLLKQGVIL